MDEKRAREIALDEASTRFPKWKEHIRPRGADPIGSIKKSPDGRIWQIKFSADNGLTAFAANIEIEVKTGALVKFEVIPGA